MADRGARSGEREDDDDKEDSEEPEDESLMPSPYGDPADPAVAAGRAVASARRPYLIPEIATSCVGVPGR